MIEHHTLERYLIGAAILYQDKMDELQALKMDDFENGIHQEIWASILELHRNEKPIDTTTIKAKSTTYEYLSECVHFCTTPQLIETHIKSLKERSAQRKIAKILNELSLKAQEGIMDSQSVISEATIKLEEMWDINSDLVPMSELVSKVRFECEMKRNNSDVTVLNSAPTGLSQLDKGGLAFGGIPMGVLTLIAAKTAQGKSAMAQTILVNSALHGRTCMYISIEDRGIALATRRISQLSGIQNRQLQRRIVGPEQWEKFDNAINELKKLPIYIYDKPIDSPEHLVAVCKGAIAKLEIKLLIIDYLQLIPSGKDYKSEQQHVDYTLNKIIQLSKSSPRTATVLISQLRRKEEDEPQLGDLYHSGKIEQAAHTVMLIWAPKVSSYPKKKLLPDGQIENIDCRVIKIAKQKDGPIENYIIGWDAETTTFRDARNEDIKNYIEEIKNRKKTIYKK